MTLLLATAVQMLHMLLVLAAAPLASGCAATLRARLLGRAGPHPLQAWRDLLRLFRKHRMVAENATAVFRTAPFVSFAAVGAAAVLVPSFGFGMLSAPVADLLAIAGLLGLSRIAVALAAMDVGTAFGGMGASRDMTLAVFAEPALLMIVFSFALLAGTTNLDLVGSLMRDGALGLRVSLGLVLIGTLCVALVENGRMPVDNPVTHLELTMIHESRVLEYSGPDLALLDYAASLKLLVWVNLIVSLFLPFGTASAEAGPLAWAIGFGFWIVKAGLLVALLALTEAAFAKMRLFRVPEFLGVAILLGLLAAMFLFVSTGFV